MIYFKTFKTYLKYLIKKKEINIQAQSQNDLRIKYLHLFKSNFIILISIKFYFLFINLISLIFKFKKIYKLNHIISNRILNILDKIFFVYTNKLDELLFAVICIQDKNFNQKSKFLRLENNKLNDKIIYDAIVIGSGPSGSITAYNLKKKFNKVLLIDKGNAIDNYSVKHPGEEFIYKWNNAGINTTLIGNQISFSSGACLGGGSEINSGLLHYPDELFVKKWKDDFDVHDLSTQSLHDNLNSLINDNVSVSFMNQKNQKLASQLFMDGIKKNNFKYEYLKKLESNSNNLISKSSMIKTLISDFINQNGDIIIKYRVDKIIKEKDLWKVSGIKNKSKINFKSKYLFLCAGSIYTNKLLIQNRLCKKNDVNFFKFHPMIKVIAEYDHEVQKGHENVHNLQITENYPNYLVGQAASSRQFLKFAAYGNETLQKEIDKKWKNMLIYHSTFSVGKGKIYNFFLKNKFIYGYKIQKENLIIFQDALTNMVNVLKDSGAKKVYFIGKKIIELDKNFKDKVESELKKISDFKISSVHILGGVKSGESRKCIVNSFGKMKNNKNLYVNDSSLINHKLLKNPQGTVMALAQRNIKNFLKDVEYS